MARVRCHHGGEPWDPKGQNEVVNQNAGGGRKWGSRRTTGKVTVPFIETEEPEDVVYGRTGDDIKPRFGEVRLEIHSQGER